MLEYVVLAFILPPHTAPGIHCATWAMLLWAIHHYALHYGGGGGCGSGGSGSSKDRSREVLVVVALVVRIKWFFAMKEVEEVVVVGSEWFARKK